MHEETHVCGECRFFFTYECLSVGMPQRGFCKRHAPRPTLVDEEDETRLWATWPLVSCYEDSCAEFRPPRDPNEL